MPNKDSAKNKEYHRKYYKDNQKTLNAYTRDWLARERLKLICEYGGKCISCGQSDPVVLDFDHINNNGHEETGKNVIFSIRRSPLSFQLLCKNCNWRKEYWRRKNAIGK